MTTTLSPTPNPPLTTPLARLQYLYQDVTRLSAISSPSLILHPADRNMSSPPRPPLVGIAAAQRHEQEFVAATGGTGVMDVESITVGRDGTFACVLGVFRAGSSSSSSSSLLQGQGQEGAAGGGGVGMKEGEGGGDGEGKTGSRGLIEMSFCGVWRFDERGRAVEHWENAADPEALVRWLKGE